MAETVNASSSNPAGSDSNANQPCIPLARPIAWTPPADEPDPREAMLLKSLPRRAAWLDLLVLTVLVVCLDFLVQGALFQISGIERPDEEALTPEIKQQLLPATIVLRSVCILILVGAILRVRGQGLDSIGLAKRGLGWNLLMALPVLGVAGGLSYAVLFLLDAIWPAVRDHVAENTQRLREMVPRLSLLGYAALMGIVGFYEEVLFRGFLMTRLRRALGTWIVAVLLSTALFAVPHVLDQTWIALVPITLLSLAFSVATIWRRSIVPAIVAHALFNFWQILMMEFALGDKPV